MTGVSNPNKPMCEDCEREQLEAHMSVIHPTCCVWCAQTRILAENAVKAAEAAKDAEAQAVEDRALAVMAAAARARELLGPRFHAEALLDGTEPITSSERDYREAEAS